MVYFNFAEIGECTSYEIEDKLEEEMSTETSRRIFIYDEFQYAATLNSAGEEKDNKSGLKPFWEMLDDGKLHKRTSFYTTFSIYRLVKYMDRINSECPIELKDGVWVNSDMCLSNFAPNEIREFSQLFNFNSRKTDVQKKCTVPENDYSYSNLVPCTEYDSQSYETEPTFIKAGFLDRIMDLYDKSNSIVSDKMELRKKICSLSFDELFELVTKLLNTARKGYDLNFSDSIIFVIGNLDEAYTIAFNADPDMSPDQFHKITKNITIVDIKESLQKRFRNEQIARLGNVHLIYPAFSSKSFNEIIKLTLERYRNEVLNLTGYNLKFKDSIVRFIYNESVFPTHGTRPIFSSIHEIVKSKLPLIVKEVYDRKLDADTFVFSAKGNKIYVTIQDKDGNKLHTLRYTEKTRVTNLRESSCDSEQSIVALHESGHFAVYAALMHKIPEKLCSKTVASNSGGFLMQDFDDVHKLHSFDMLMNKIKITLAGYCAERMIFGNEYMSVGSSSDLRKATSTASYIVRDYGYYSPIVTTYMMSPDIAEEGHMVKKDKNEIENEAIRSIIDSCVNEVYDILSKPCWRKLLKESAKYLSVNSNMSKKKMQELYDEVSEECKINKKDSEYYKKKIEEIAI